MDLRREKDIEQLRRVAMLQQVQIEQLLKVLAAKCDELRALKGDETELQQTLALIETLTARAQNEQATSEPAPTREYKPRSKVGPTQQTQLEHVEREYTLDAADETCPSCGGELAPMEGQFATSDLIDVIEVSYRVVKVKQQKYVCRCGGCIETAPGPERAIAGGRYSLAFAVKVAIDKYLDHLPLARQERILDRHGLIVTSQTLWDQIEALARNLRGAYDALFAKLMAEPVIGLDQTSWKRLETKRSKPWQIWCVTAPGLVYHRIYDDKGAATFKALVGQYDGVIVCDALKTHEAGARDGPGIHLAACWAHVFRKFEEAAPNHPEATFAMQWIRKLYELDASVDSVEARAEIRRTQSTEVLAEMKSWLWSHATLKTLSIGKAAGYAIANWERLTRFVEDARIPLDNNATERAIRGPVVGRRNHFGSKSRRGTEVAAIFYSLIETAKLCGVDPARYLLEAVRAARLGETLLPHQLAL